MIEKQNGSKSNLTSTKRCKLKSVQLQVIVNIVTYSLSIRNMTLVKKVLLTTNLLIKKKDYFNDYFEVGSILLYIGKA